MTLYDILGRNAVLVECLKFGRVNHFGSVALTLRKTIKSILANVDERNIGDLTKAQLTVLQKSIMNACHDEMSQWSQDFLDWLEEFNDDNIDVQKMLIASFERGDGTHKLTPLSIASANGYFRELEDEKKWVPFMGWAALMQNGGYQTIYSRVKAFPSPATGSTLVDTLKGVVDAVGAALGLRTAQAWANGETVDELADALVGKGVNGLSSVMDKQQNGINSTINTVVQTVFQYGNRIVQSAAYQLYQWVSVMDSRTSEICRERNLKIYVYGKGPVPPAHMNCRSHTVPYKEGQNGPEPESFYSWIKNQTSEFLDTVLDSDAAERIKKGTARAEDFQNFKPTKAISLQDYMKSVSITLS